MNTQTKIKISWTKYAEVTLLITFLSIFRLQISTSIQSLYVLQVIRQWLNHITIQNANFAHHLCKFIPAHCPFERNIKIFTYNLHIPPLCKLNPLYEELMSLRFRALSYLADECGEDITQYCTLSNR
ncbi:Mo-dependent nitrogenase family protein [Gloeocapsa sp. PCC 7428]|nr:Mo-dependent nitrogenase family protein [Gloeocapsa sp. PCC 7428]